MAFLNFALLSFVSLLAIVNPIPVVPAFIAMTEGNRDLERLRIARLAS